MSDNARAVLMELEMPIMEMICAATLAARVADGSIRLEDKNLELNMRVHVCDHVLAVAEKLKMAWKNQFEIAGGE